MCNTTQVCYEDGTVCNAVYRYLRCALVSQQSVVYGHTVTNSAVTSAGYELALVGSQTLNIWLPNKDMHMLAIY